MVQHCIIFAIIHQFIISLVHDYQNNQMTIKLALKKHKNKKIHNNFSSTVYPYLKIKPTSKVGRLTLYQTFIKLPTLLYLLTVH